MRNNNFVHVIVNNGKSEYLIDGLNGLVDGGLYDSGDEALKVLCGYRIFPSESIRYFNGGGTIRITIHREGD